MLTYSQQPLLDIKSSASKPTAFNASLRLRWSSFWRKACLWTALLGASASNREISAELPSPENALRRLPRRRRAERLSAGAGGRGNDFGEASSSSADARPPTTDAASIGGFCEGQPSSMMHGGRVVIVLIDVYNDQNRNFLVLLSSSAGVFYTYGLYSRFSRTASVGIDFSRESHTSDRAI